MERCLQVTYIRITYTPRQLPQSCFRFILKKIQAHNNGEAIFLISDLYHLYIVRFVQQRATHKLNQIITEYGLTISVQKTKSMAFRGRDPVTTKIVIDNKIIEKMNSFN